MVRVIFSKYKSDYDISLLVMHQRLFIAFRTSYYRQYGLQAKLEPPHLSNLI